jgi:hypothetical protein
MMCQIFDSVLICTSAEISPTDQINPCKFSPLPCT